MRTTNPPEGSAASGSERPAVLGLLCEVEECDNAVFTYAHGMALCAACAATASVVRADFEAWKRTGSATPSYCSDATGAPEGTP